MEAESPTVLVLRGGAARYWPGHSAVIWLASQVPLGLPQRDGYSPSPRGLGSITRDGTIGRAPPSTSAPAILASVPEFSCKTPGPARARASSRGALIATG